MPSGCGGWSAAIATAIARRGFAGRALGELRACHFAWHAQPRTRWEIGDWIGDEALTRAEKKKHQVLTRPAQTGAGVYDAEAEGSIVGFCGLAKQRRLEQGGHRSVN